MSSRWFEFSRPFKHGLQFVVWPLLALQREGNSWSQNSVTSWFGAMGHDGTVVPWKVDAFFQTGIVWFEF